MNWREILKEDELEDLKQWQEFNQDFYDSQLE